MFTKRTRLGIIVIFTILYLSTVGRTHISFADSDELTIVGYLGGVAHPPGYPILINLIYLATQISFLNPAYTANLLAAFIQITNLILIFTIAKNINSQLNFSTKTATISAFITTMIIGLTSIFWFQANVIEKYSLALTFTLSSLWAALTIKRPYRPLILCLLIGFGTTYHELYWPILPIIFYVLKQSQALKTIRLKHFAIIGLSMSLPLSLVWITNYRVLPFSFNFPATIPGFLTYLSRQSIYVNHLSGHFQQPLQAVTAVIHSFLTDTLYLPLVLILIGVNILRRRSKHVLVILFGLISMYVIIIPGYIGWPISDPNNIASFQEQRLLLRRLYLFPFSMLGLLVSIGLTRILEKYPFKSILSLLALYLTLLTINHYPQVNLRPFTTTKELTTSILDTLPPKSVVILGADYGGFSMLYQTLVANYRPDISVFVTNYRFRQRYILDQSLISQSFTSNPAYIFDLISTSLSHDRPVFVADLPASWYSQMQLDQGGLYATTHHQLLQLHRDPGFESQSFPNSIIPPEKLLISPFLNSLQAERLTLGGYINQLQDNSATASAYLRRAQSHSAWSYPTLINLINHPVSPNPLYTKEIDSPPNHYFDTQAIYADQTNQPQKAIAYALVSLLKNPNSTPAAIILSR